MGLVSLSVGGVTDVVPPKNDAGKYPDWVGIVPSTADAVHLHWFWGERPDPMAIQDEHWPSGDLVRFAVTGADGDLSTEGVLVNPVVVDLRVLNPIDPGSGNCVSPGETYVPPSNYKPVLHLTALELGAAAQTEPPPPPPPVPRSVVGTETLALNDQTVTTLAAVPAGANHAEVHVWSAPGCGVVWTISGVNPDAANAVGHRTSDGGHFELESAAEVAAFKAMGLPGCLATLHVTYFELNTHVE